MGTVSPKKGDRGLRLQVKSPMGDQDEENINSLTRRIEMTKGWGYAPNETQR